MRNISTDNAQARRRCTLFCCVFFFAFSWPCKVRSISTFPLRLHNTARLRLPAITPHPQYKYNLSLSSVAPIWWKHRIHHRCRSSIFLFVASFHTLSVWLVFIFTASLFLFSNPLFHSIPAESLPLFWLKQMVLVASHPFGASFAAKMWMSRITGQTWTIRTHYEIFDSFRWNIVFELFSSETGSLICSILFGQLHRCISCSNYSNHQILTHIYALETHLFQFECQESV